MATKPKPTTLAAHPRVDQRGLDWQAAANKAWEESGHDLAAWENAPERQLPDFNAEKPEHVKREALGGYVYDAATNTMHRLATAMPECKLDAIALATWIHHFHEAKQLQPGATPCAYCLPVLVRALALIETRTSP